MIRSGRRRSLAVVALLVYSIFLCIASLPGQTLNIPVVSYPIYIAKKVMYYFKIEPGIVLFYRPHKEYSKPGRQCITVKFFDEERRFQGKEDIGFGCEYFIGFRFFNDPLAVMKHRFLGAAFLEHKGLMAYYESQGKSAGKNLTSLELKLFAAFADYYCHSDLVPGNRPKPGYLSIGWDQEQIDYENPKNTSEGLILLVRWKCGSHEQLSAEWELEISQENGAAFSDDRF